MREPVCCLLFLLCLVAAPAAPAQTVRVDTTTAVTLREPASATLDAYRTDPAYRYDRPPPEADTWWTRFTRWFRETFFGWMDDARAGELFRWTIYALAAFGVVFAILRLLRMEASGAFQRRSRAPTLALETVEENLDTLDFDRLLDEAIGARQYRRAVRLLYLKTLKRLADAGLIDWQRDKTNHAYVAELRRAALRPAFARLTLLFEHVWYGDFPVDEAAFGRLRHHFSQFEDAFQNG